ncbi:hypothetical protein [Paraburkholderia sp. BR14374]|uniref:hypothetical protein n=1 Tax=Paraburkholderia sp. BR14374 TaxID=3237007 RepID=UPI0034CE417F
MPRIYSKCRKKFSTDRLKNKNYLKKIDKHFFRLMMRKNDDTDGAGRPRQNRWKSASFGGQGLGWAGGKPLSSLIAAKITSQNAQKNAEILTDTI